VETKDYGSGVAAHNNMARRVVRGVSTAGRGDRARRMHKAAHAANHNVMM